VGAFLIAWLAGEGIMIYRSVKVQGGPPWPGQLLAGTGAFAALAVLAEAGPDARKIALAVAWGLNAAGFMALFPASPALMGNALGTLTGTNPANSGWWGNVTANTVSDTSVLPAAGGCGPAGSGTGAGGSAGASTGGSPGASIKAGEQSGTKQTYPGGCPAGYMNVGGKCYEVVGMAYNPAPSPAAGTTLV
jgi:hypothetical protein